MPEADPQDSLFDQCGSHLVTLLRRGTTERPFGSVTIRYSWKYGLLTKRTVDESQETLLIQPKAED